MNFHRASRADSSDSSSDVFVRRLGSGSVREHFGRAGSSGISSHLRSARKRRLSLPRWLVLTVAAGMFVALIFLNFFAH